MPDQPKVRRSARAYTSRPVDPATLLEIVAQSRLAPSGSNLQPGTLFAVQGARRQNLTHALSQAWREGATQAPDYSYFAHPLPMRLRKRQVAAAQALYGSLGISRDNRSGRDSQFDRNFYFFDAPVALIACVEQNAGAGAYLDLGMQLYGLMLAAHERGLATCAIGAIAAYPDLVRQHLSLGNDWAIVCGMALGYADTQAPVNTTCTERAELDEYFRVIE